MNRSGFRLSLLLPAVVSLTLLAMTSGCARPASIAVGADAGTERAAAGTERAAAGFSFGTDTFAFPNEIRSRHPAEPDLYANYCFVMARSLRQFFAGARFAPDETKVDRAAYVRRVRAVVARPPWTTPSSTERVVIPGYVNLREFSAAESAAVKEGMGGRFWTLVHWTNWRVTFPVTGDHQAGVAREIVDELARGRLVQLLVTNWPKPELNHTVVAYAAATVGSGATFTVWDPNDPNEPGRIAFDPARREFVATRLYDTEVGPIRVFRMGYSWFL